MHSEPKKYAKNYEMRIIQNRNEMISYYQLKKNWKKSWGGPKIRSNLSKIRKNFYQIFSIFLIFDNFDLIFGPPILFFPIFFQLIITYHVFFILDEPHFIIFYVFFWVKMHIIPIFYQFFSFLTNFDLIMWHPYIFKAQICIKLQK